MAPQIDESCPLIGCDGTVSHFAERHVRGSGGICDTCGASFVLLGGVTSMVAPPIDGDAYAS